MPLGADYAKKFYEIGHWQQVEKQLKLGSAKANRREPKTCLGRVFNYKLGCFEDVHETHVSGCTLTSTVGNSAQVLSC